MRRILIGLAMTIVLPGCNGTSGLNSSDGFTLNVAPETVSPGGEVTLTLRNHARETGGYNLCTSQLARQTNGAWDPVPEDRICTMELRTLAPGEEASFALSLPEDLPADHYRYTTGVELMETSGREEISSEAFRVAAGP